MRSLQIALVACPACACHHRADVAACPHCGAAVSQSGERSRTAAAVILGLTLATGGLAGCGDDSGSGGAGGSGTTTSTTTSTKSSSSSTTAQTTTTTTNTTNSVSSAYGTAASAGGGNGG